MLMTVVLIVFTMTMIMTTVNDNHDKKIMMKNMIMRIWMATSITTMTTPIIPDAVPSPPPPPPRASNSPGPWPRTCQDPPSSSLFSTFLFVNHLFFSSSNT